MSDLEIIERLGGGDLTRGSCASLAWAYVAQKQGYDVLDFRDGSSRYWFSLYTSTEDIVATCGFPYLKNRVVNAGAIVSAKDILKQMDVGGTYVYIVGAHAALVRRTTKENYQYLELQSGRPDGNGWQEEFTLKTATPILKRRFGCRYKNTTDVAVNVDDINGDDFLYLLGYINTPEDEQRKGSQGYER